MTPEQIFQILKENGWTITNSWDGGNKLCLTNKDFPNFGLFYITGDVNAETMAEILPRMNDFEATLNISISVGFRISPRNNARLFALIPKEPKLIVTVLDKYGLAGWVMFYMSLTTSSRGMKSAYKRAVDSGKKTTSGFIFH